ncbi:MAG: DinB family protein [Saprospiraceae bacterium]|nr:DinB family protein [Saprospiraceae bacterium]MCB0574874.1 DinB family protein [Saprospiraceae bacterium]
MTTEQLLKDYAAYNLWANRRIVEWLRQAPQEWLLQETPSSFPTVYHTVIHIWGAEKVWIERLNEEPPVAFLSEYFDGTAEEAFEGWLACSARFSELLAGQDAVYFSGRATYLRYEKRYSEIRAQMILHCLQHSTYHRGQLVTMGRALGLSDPPSTDYIGFARLQEKDTAH